MTSSCQRKPIPQITPIDRLPDSQLTDCRTVDWQIAGQSGNGSPVLQHCVCTMKNVARPPIDRLPDIPSTHCQTFRQSIARPTSDLQREQICKFTIFADIYIYSQILKWQFIYFISRILFNNWDADTSILSIVIHGLKLPSGWRYFILNTWLNWMLKPHLILWISNSRITSATLNWCSYV